MSGSMIDYFILEATDYVDQMERHISGEDPVDGGQLHPLARALRGAARLHELEDVARATGPLEELARALKDGAVEWSDEYRGHVERTLDDLRILIRGAREWNEEMEERARAVASRWEAVDLPDREEDSGGEETEGDVADFVRREVRGVHEALREAARRLDEGADSGEALRMIGGAIATLAGAAWLNRFPAVEDAIRAVEEATEHLQRRAASVRGRWLEFFHEARDAVGRVADGLEREEESEVPGLRALVQEMLGRGFASEEEVVPIEMLFHDDEGPHVLSRRDVVEAGAGDVSEEIEEGEEEAEELPVEVRNFFLIEVTSLVDRMEELLRRVEAGEVASARDLGQTLRDLARIFDSFQFPETAGALGALAERGDEAGEREPALEAVSRALPELRSLVEEVDDPECVSVRTAAVVALARREEEALAEADEEEAAETTEEALAEVGEGAPVEPDEEASVEADAGAVVPVQELLYSGEAALRRARALREEVGSALAREDREAVEVCLDELVDLVGLAAR